MDVDLLDGDFYTKDPYPTYAWLRENEPVYWDATNELWGVSRYDDIEFIEKHAELFINSDQDKGGYRPNIPADAVDDRARRSRAPSPAAQPRRPPVHAEGGRRAGRPRSAPPSRPVRRRGGEGREGGDHRGPRRAAAGDDDRQAARLHPPEPGPSCRLVRAHDHARRRSALPRRGRDDRGDGVRAGIGRAARGEGALPGRRRDDGLDPGRDRRVPDERRHQRSPTRCSSSTAAPRRPAR